MKGKLLLGLLFIGLSVALSSCGSASNVLDGVLSNDDMVQLRQESNMPNNTSSHSHQEEPQGYIFKDAILNLIKNEIRKSPPVSEEIFRAAMIEINCLGEVLILYYERNDQFQFWVLHNDNGNIVVYDVIDNHAPPPSLEISYNGYLFSGGKSETREGYLVFTFEKDNASSFSTSRSEYNFGGPPTINYWLNMTNISQGEFNQLKNKYRLGVGTPISIFPNVLPDIIGSSLNPTPLPTSTPNPEPPQTSTPVSDFEWVINDESGGVTITRYIGSDKTVEIPSEITGRPVTHIGTLAFYMASPIENLVIPNSITHIGDWAFNEMTSLKKLIIPSSIIYMGRGAFSHATSLTDLIFEYGITHIGSGAFQNANSLINLTIPNSVTHIGDSAFYSAISLVNLIIPNSVTHIGGAVL